MIWLHKIWQQIRKPHETGQSLVEFALVLIFIIIPFIFVFIETSTILYKYVAITNSAREGVRTGSIYLYMGDPGGSSAAPDAGRSGEVSAAVSQTLGPLIGSPPDCNGTSAGTICLISYGPSSSLIPDPLRSTEPFTVTVTHTHPFLFGALGSSIDLEAQASMRIEPSSVITGP
ncbi:MAG: pilus assembly protein [Anaerolineae bacterium]|nr:pilus assembly protein [Anaerolineae bacterium]